jgi:hypothetical protein
MSDRCDIFLHTGEGTREDLAAAMTADLAEKLMSTCDAGVTVFGRVAREDLPAGCACAGAKARCIADAVRSYYERRKAGRLVVGFGLHPLYGAVEIPRAARLLDLEDATVAYGSAAGDADPVVLLGMERQHAGIVDSMRGGFRGPTLAAVVASESVVIPLRTMHGLADAGDYAWLLHEVEREMLLGHWFPGRTYAVLQQMQRRHILPELQ